MFHATRLLPESFDVWVWFCSKCSATAKHRGSWYHWQSLLHGERWRMTRPRCDLQRSRSQSALRGEKMNDLPGLSHGLWIIASGGGFLACFTGVVLEEHWVYHNNCHQCQLSSQFYWFEGCTNLTFVDSNQALPTTHVGACGALQNQYSSVFFMIYLLYYQAFLIGYCSLLSTLIVSTTFGHYSPSVSTVTIHIHGS